MPCVRVSINNDILCTIKKRSNNSIINISSNTLVISIMSVPTRVPFKPYGIIVGNIIVKCNAFKKIKIKKFQEIIQKYNDYLDNGYICCNHKNELIKPIMDEVKLFIKFIFIKMKYEEEKYTICFNKLYWKYL